jgi:ketosteroid isomerase-like protein
VPDEDIEIVRRAWAAFSRNDESAILAECHPDVVAIPFGAVMEGTAYRGHDQLLKWWRHEILVTWEFFEVYPESFERVDDKLLVTGRWKARGSESGVQLDMPAAWVVEVRDGKIAYWQTYTDDAQARDDIGLKD